MPYVVCAMWRAKEGEAEHVAAAIEKLTGPSRAEPGSLLYQAHRSLEDPNVFLLYEQYADSDAYQAHLDSEHFKRHAIDDGIPRLESRERSFYETWPPEGATGAGGVGP